MSDEQQPRPGPADDASNPDPTVSPGLVPGMADPEERPSPTAAVAPSTPEEAREAWGADQAEALAMSGDGAAPSELEVHRRPARVLAFANQKGGVGKTTTAINLGAALVELGSRVLLVDMDPQGSLGVGLSAEPYALEQTVYNLLLQDGTAAEDVVLQTPVAGMDLLPSNIDLAAAELLLVQEVAREQSLRRVIERLRPDYDFVLIDCPPSLGLLTINGLTAAHGVIVPLECEYFALRGMSLLMETFRKVQERLNPDLELEGIVATLFDGRPLHIREVLERVREAFGELVFKTTINKTIRFAEAPVVGEPILTYSPRSKGAEAYRDLAKEILARESAS